AIFAFSCALLIEPLVAAEEAAIVATEPRRSSVQRQQAEILGKTRMPLSSSQVSSTITAQRQEISQPPPQAGGRWGEQIAWQIEGQKSKVQHPPDVPSQSGGAASSQAGRIAPSQGATAPSTSGAASRVAALSRSGAAAPSSSTAAPGATAPSRSGAAAPSQT